ncbi:hypothetical protein D3C87_1309910 [compost metagenome]
MVLLDDVRVSPFSGRGDGHGQTGEGLFAQAVQFRRALAGMRGDRVVSHQPRHLLYTGVELHLQRFFERVATQRQELQCLRGVVGRDFEQ